MTNRQHLWSQLETELRALLASMNDFMPAKDAKMVGEFIEHREYGLALETMDLSAKEEKIARSPEQMRQFEHLAKLMGMDPQNISME